jgi:hypothetical protein
MTSNSNKRASATAAILTALCLVVGLVLTAWNYRQGLNGTGTISLLASAPTTSTSVGTETSKPAKTNPRFAAMMAKARKLQQEAEVYMNHGKVRGGKAVQLPFGSSKSGTVLCEASGAKEGLDSHYLERELGCDGSIPPSVAKSWRKQIDAMGGSTVPPGTFYDSTNSQVWSGGHAKQWDPVEHDGREDGGHVAKFGPNNEDWLNPKRWVAERKLDWQAQAALGDMQLSPEPYTNAGHGVIATPFDETFGNGKSVDWDRLLKEVEDRYDHPLDNK